MKRAHAVLWAGLLVSSCGGPKLQGATVAAQGSEPRPSRVLIPNDCRDAQGIAATGPSRLWITRAADGRDLLVEARDGYDSILVWNRRDIEGVTVFQYFSEYAGRRLLHEVRLCLRCPDTTGSLHVSDRFIEERQPGHGVARSRRVVLACRLDMRDALE